MTIYTANYSNFNIELKEGNNEIIKIPISNLLLNNGNHPTNDKKGDSDFEINQQQVNYLDSIKDGTNVFLLQNLNIYPKSGNLPFEKLKNFEHTIFERKKDYLTHTTWLKVKKGSVLDPPKEYQQCLWESGLGFDVFLANPDKVKTIKTFGSYIDPLEKQNAKNVWPPIGSKIELTESFMKLMGFGEKSSVSATTKNNTDFIYTLNIACGDACKKCFLTEEKDDEGKDSKFYFAGNNVKNDFIKGKATTSQKVKFIVVKEWGDKVQVLIYLIYHNLLQKNKSDTVIMITCDMVVYMLCLNLGIGCIYTGVYYSKGKKQDPNKKYYSVLEYKPSDNPFREAFGRLKQKIENIRIENNSFLECITKLVENPDTEIIISGDKPTTFVKPFYEALLDDMNKIQSEFETESKKLIDNYTKTKEIDEKNKIGTIEQDLKSIQQKYLLIPFIRIKKGTKNKLIILMTKSYTLDNKNADKKGIYNILFNKNIFNSEKECKKSFLELGIKYFKLEDAAPQAGGGEKRKLENDIEYFTPFRIEDAQGKCSNSLISAPKGRILNENLCKRNKLSKKILDDREIENSFPMDETDYESYIYITNDEHENYNEQYRIEDETKAFHPDFNSKTIHLLQELRQNFDSVLNNSKYVNETYFENFYHTIYTLFVYKSYLEGQTTTDFREDDLQQIIEEYYIVSENKSSIFSFGNLFTNKMEDKKRKLNIGLYEEPYKTLRLVSAYGGKKTKTLKTKKNKTRKNKKAKRT